MKKLKHRNTRYILSTISIILALTIISTITCSAAAKSYKYQSVINTKDDINTCSYTSYQGMDSLGNDIYSVKRAGSGKTIIFKTTVSKESNKLVGKTSTLVQKKLALN